MHVWCENEEAPKHMLQRVLIMGAKKQCNFLTVTSPTTCLTSEWQFTLTDGLNNLRLFFLEPTLPSSTPSSKIRLRYICDTVEIYVHTILLFYKVPHLWMMSSKRLWLTCLMS